MNPQSHILVVDDELIIRELVAAHFRSLDFDVSVAEHGKEALMIMSRKHIDILIVDLQMPVMDGLELLKTVRGQHPFVRSVVLTGCATFENVLSTLEAGAFCFVTKPITDMQPLENAVNQALAVVRSWHDQLTIMQRLKTKVHRP